MKPNYFKNTNTNTILLFFLVQLIFNVNIVAQVIEENENEEIINLNLDQIRFDLLSAPEESSAAAAIQQTLISLPLPNGVQKTFSAQESSVMDKKLAVKYPEIKSYILFDAEGKSAGRMSVTPKGASYSIFTENGLAFLENFKDESENTAHKIYYGDLNGEDFGCNTVIEERLIQPNIANSRFNNVSTGGTLRTYRIAIASSGEFTVGNGNTTASVNAVFNEKLNQLNAIFEKELTIRFVLAANNDNLIFFNAATDGLEVNNRLNSAETVINANMASSDYDIGHVFYEIDLCTMSGDCMCNSNCSSTSGVATLGSACQSYKARGWTGATSTASDDLFMGTFAHEIGHQFGAHHSYYGTANNCNQRSPGNGYEPGSGNSIMSYEGTCGSQNITPEASTFYFHIHSLIQMLNHANGAGNCFSSTATGNTPPAVTVPANVTIPHGTPFTITGSATDADGDNLTYIWEQYDTDNSAGGAPNAAASSTTAPLFRSFDPSSDGNVRTFPQISDILNDTQTQGEILPQVARTMHFRLTARDNNASGGGMHCDEVAITVDDSGVPFAVTAPAAGSSYTANGSNMITVSWNEGTTANAPINCSTVDILLSTDGGNTFPISLATGVANDGIESIVLPGGLPNTTTARIKVTCTNGGVQFFDISDGDFAISSTCIAQTSTLCPTETTSAEMGNAALNLSTTPLFENATLGSLSTTIDASDPTAPRAYATSQGGTTCTSGNTRNYERYDFTVDVSGTYSLSSTFSVFNISSIFLKSGFNPASPCTGTLIGSNGYLDGNSIRVFSPATVNLVECTEYSLLVYANPTTTETITLSGGGNVISFTTQSGGTSYTYIAINQTNNQVAAVSSTADFRTLAGGGATYSIYGVSYDNSETPNSWVGLSQSTLVDGTRCLLQSNNFSTLTVTGGVSCPNTLDVTTVADGQTYEAANTLTSSIVIPPTNTVTFHAGQSITLGVGFHAAPTSTHTFTAAISSCTPLQAPAVARNNNLSEDLAEQTDLTIHPNPARDYITIDYQLNALSTTSIGLYDMTGKKLMDIVPMQSQAKGKYQQQLNLGELTEGMYFVLLQTETEQISQKLILVR